MEHSYATRPNDIFTHPPSPVWSDCDSLDGIEDLDAYLDAQGQLSHFPTPPMCKDKTIVYETEIDMSDDEEELDSHRIAGLFTEHATIGIDFNNIDVLMIERMLLRADLPLEVLALAFNILNGLYCRSLPIGSFYSAPNDLIVVTALSLAVSYTSDFPPTARYWSRNVCDGMWTPIRVDKTTLQVYAALGWRLHSYSAPSAIRRAMEELTTPVSLRRLAIRSRPPPNACGYPDSTAPEPVKLVIEGTGTVWENGQITPDGSLPDCGFVGVESRFLPLL